MIGDHSGKGADVPRRRRLAIAWTRVCRELGKALAEFEDSPDAPALPGGNNLTDLSEALVEMLAYRDELRAWAELPPGDGVKDQPAWQHRRSLNVSQRDMVDQLDQMEDTLNERGHSMNEREK